MQGLQVHNSCLSSLTGSSELCIAKMASRSSHLLSEIKNWREINLIIPIRPIMAWIG